MTEPQPPVAFTRVRRDINSRIREHLDGLHVDYTMEQQPDGRRLYRVGGELLNTGEAADRYLPGGFAANFGSP